jgi:hypothetical protein
MTASDLDDIYTNLCKTMTTLGEENTALFLARFALLAIGLIDNPGATGRLIDEAREGMIQ